MDIEVKSLYDEVMTLKMAIEEAIIKGQKSVDDLNDVHWSGPVSNKKFATTHTNEGSRVVGWVDDF